MTRKRRKGENAMEKTEQEEIIESYEELSKRYRELMEKDSKYFTAWDYLNFIMVSKLLRELKESLPDDYFSVEKALE